jgi:hypothetical protein
MNTNETTKTTVYEIHDKQGAYDKQFRIATADEIESAIVQAIALEQWDKTTNTMKNRTREEITNALNAGREISFAPTANYYYTHDMKRIRIQPEPIPAPVMVKCSCGHSVPRGSVMSASTGTSCPDCYDRMSE